MLLFFQSSKPGSRNLWVSLNRTQFRLAEIPTSSATKVQCKVEHNFNVSCDCNIEPGISI